MLGDEVTVGAAVGPLRDPLPIIPPLPILLVIPPLPIPIPWPFLELVGVGQKVGE